MADKKDIEDENKYKSGPRRDSNYWETRKDDWLKLHFNETENTKNGRPKAFQDPAHFWEIAIGYFQKVDGAPWLKKDYKGKDAYEVDIPTQSPYLWAGFDDYCLEMGICAGAEHYRTASRNPEYREGTYKAFSGVVRAVDGIITQQKISGALVGAFNSNLVARIEGLADKTETDITVKETRIGFE
jgi:hypothetical protein